VLKKAGFFALEGDWRSRTSAWFDVILARGLFEYGLGLVNGLEAPGDVALAVANGKNALAFQAKIGNFFAIKSAGAAFGLAQQFELLAGLNHALITHRPR
jgi:hypothetical protein